MAVSAREFFDRLNIKTMGLVDEFYHPEAVFRDPSTQVRGRAAIKAHYAHQYARLTSIRWEWEPDLVSGDELMLRWTMVLSHPALNGGREYAVPGCSYIRFQEGLAIEHRDYFDMGAFVYERLPVIKTMIQALKSRMTVRSNA